MNFQTPILFLVFNRPHETKQVFEAIKKLQPQKLYIAADGPREGNEVDEVKCVEVKNILANINWPCQTTTLFRKRNLGCKIGVSQAITWFFDHEEEGIILEDDCLPDQSFFHFCENMLNRYRSDHRIMHVSGFNVLNKWKDDVQSYHFSFFGTIWGWATWKRSWKFYDVLIGKWKDEKVQKKILSTYFPKEYRESRKLLYDEVYNGEIDTWDYQWTFCRLLMNGLSIIPARNLVINIGFDIDATHTKSEPEWAPKETFNHAPPYIYNGDARVDKKYEAKHLQITNLKKKQTILNKLRDKINRGRRKIEAILQAKYQIK